MRINKDINKNKDFVKRISLLFLLLSLAFGLCSCRKETKVTLALTPGLDNRIVKLTENGQYDQVLKLYEQRLEEIEEDSYEAANIHVWMGDFYFTYIENIDKAIEHLEKAYELSEQNQYMQVWADACYVLSSIYVELEDNVSLGLQYAEQAEKLYEELSGENTIEVADTLRNKGMLYYEAEQWHEALQNFEAAEVIYESLDQATGYTCICIGRTFVKLQEFERAEEMFQKAQNIAAQKEEKYYLALSRIYLGWLCTQKEEYDGALAFYQDALGYFESFESSGDFPVDTALVCNNLAYCYAEIEGDIEKGISYAIRACQAIGRLDLDVKGAEEEKEYYKQKLKGYFEKWKTDSSDDDFEAWYQSVVLDGEEWSGWEEDIQ